MKMKLINKVVLLGGLLLMAGCGKDDVYNTPHPEQGAVRVTTDWSDVSSDAVLPSSYLLRIGAQEQTVSGASNVFAALLDPGSYQLLVYHAADGITCSGNTATVNTLPDGTLEPLPGYLFSAARTLEVVKDDTLHVNLKMQQRIRHLTLTLKLKPGDEQRIASTFATLSGVASGISLIDGAITATSGQTVAPVFTLGTLERNTRTAGQPILIAHLRLAGVMVGEKQKLTLNILMKEGNEHVIITDLTEALAKFGTEDLEPLELDAVLQLPVQGSFNATIGEWNVVDNGKIDIN